MSSWLPIPQSLDELHPLVVHFPLALLLVAPVFMFLGLIRPRREWRFSVAALLLMLMGTAGAWVAVASGVAAGQLAEQTEAIQATMMEHQKMAGLTRLIFTVLTVVYGVMLAVPLIWKAAPAKALVAVHLVFLAAFAGSTLVVARTGHLGGVLVHTHGVHAMLSGPAEPAPAEPAATEPAAGGAEIQPTTATQAK